MGNLVDPIEKRLFVVILLISLAVWLPLVILTFGGIFVIFFFIFIFYLFGQSAFISYLKGNGALITKDQFPDLFKNYQDCLTKLNVVEAPVLVLINSNGVFNALATRFLGTNYVVLYSDVVDALKDDSEAINFYIGHELGHILRKHLVWDVVLIPGSILPLIGAAYSRSRETTCDSYGAYCCTSKQSAMRGMAALVVGAEKWKELNFGSYFSQLHHTSGFWMSFHEIVGNYPWLVKRMARIGGIGGKMPNRSALAWIPAIFVPRLTLMSFVVIYLFLGLGVGGFIQAQDMIKNMRNINAQSQMEYVEDDLAEIYNAPEVKSEPNFADIPAPAPVVAPVVRKDTTQRNTNNNKHPNRTYTARPTGNAKTTGTYVKPPNTTSRPLNNNRSNNTGSQRYYSDPDGKNQYNPNK